MECEEPQQLTHPLPSTSSTSLPLVPQNTQELLSDLIHQSMLVFNSLREFRLTESDENRHKNRLERITGNSDAVIRTFRQLRENCAILDRHTSHLSEEEREASARESIMKTLEGGGAGEKEGAERGLGVEQLERKKQLLEEELEFYNGQLKEIVDDTRQLINDVNSLQFYS